MSKSNKLYKFLLEIAHLNSTVPKGHMSSYSSPEWFRNEIYAKKDAAIRKAIQEIKDMNDPSCHYSIVDTGRTRIVYFNLEGRQISFHTLLHSNDVSKPNGEMPKWVGTRNKRIQGRVFSYSEVNKKLKKLNETNESKDFKNFADLYK